ncbi:MAG: BlaI/MecI/CopY family transcriptional regulator [Gemmatimonadota bacterium]|jgi:predicted transcriptional regulator|nr:BlaI/MecI/CopY family transcriptional regulator [Gemmatimonadota bacterium]MDQ3606621.1 BlaI/MecI/CopY family transcriptional regulator [Gemmatimonadota bacterium]
MPHPSPHLDLSRRERQIMDVVYRLGRVTTQEVLERLPDPPSYSAVRAMLRILEEKGHLEHEQDGPRYVYLPTVPRDSASESALKHLVRTFFGGSTEAAVAALLDISGEDLSDAELDRLSNLIDKAREQGR